MQKDEQIRLRQANFRQTNAYAMQNGIILGLWAIACQACYILGLTTPICSTIWLFMFLGIPVVTWILTLRFRKIVGLDINFPFARGFMHAFLCLLYCAVWAGVSTFIYMQFFEQGFIFDTLTKNLTDPAMVSQMEASGLTQQISDATDGMTIVDVINELRSVGAGNWAALIIYLYMFTSPIISVIVGLLTMHRVHFQRQQ